MLHQVNQVKKIVSPLMYFIVGTALGTALLSGCSWQGTSYDRGGDLHNGTAADWNAGNGRPGSGDNAASKQKAAPAPEASSAR